MQFYKEEVNEFGRKMKIATVKIRFENDER